MPVRALPVLLVASLLPVASAGALDFKTPPGWTEASRTEELAVFYKDDAQTNERTFKGCIEINATPQAVYNLVTDFESHPKFMPFTKESKIVAHLNATEVIGYQRISPPLLSDRDCYLHVKLTPGTTATGGVYRSEWNAVPTYGPTRDGIVRMPTAEGVWLFEPLDGGRRTRVTYTALTVMGGSIPKWISNRANVSVIPKILKAIRAQLTK